MCFLYHDFPFCSFFFVRGKPGSVYAIFWLFSPKVQTLGAELQMYRHRRETHEHCNTLGSFLSTIQKRSHSNIRAQNYQARSKCLCFKTVLLFSVLQKRWRWGASFLFSFFVRLVLLVRKTTWFFSSLLLKLSTLNAVQREFLISFIISLISNDNLCFLVCIFSYWSRIH